MSALTEARNTLELLGVMCYERVVADSNTVYAGALVAQNSSGYAVPAADATGLTVLGRAENTASAGETVRIRSGIFLFDNGTSGEALAVTDIGSPAFVLDDHTVGKVGGTYAVPAGIVVDVSADGVAVDCSPDIMRAAALKVYAAATASALGLVKQAAAVADCTPAGGSAVSVETQLNALLAALRTAGVLTANA